MPRRLPLLSVAFAAFAARALVAFVLLALIASSRGLAQESDRAVPSVFFIAKSENRNQVHYGIRLDAACRPAGDTPVFAYWRMLERGPLATEPLLALEQGAYGVSAQRVAARNASGGTVLVTLNALPKRPVFIESIAVGATCTATARATINGVFATLTSVFVQLRWPFGVDSLLISGRASDGRLIRERITN
ncbi:MAG: DUF4833 domain-containing protein [Polyangiaceae bacterium]